MHYPSTPTSIDSKILARPECYDQQGARTLENLPRGPSGDGGVLEGEKGLESGDLQKLDGLWGTLKRVGEAAREEGIKVAVDAEHSWYQVSRPEFRVGGASQLTSVGRRRRRRQPAIDGYTMLLSQEYNRMPKQTAVHKKEIERSLPVF